MTPRGLCSAYLAANAQWTFQASGTGGDPVRALRLEEGPGSTFGEQRTLLDIVPVAADPTWMDVASKDTPNNILFVVDQVGLMCGEDGVILRSTNGGVQWAAGDSCSNAELHALWQEESNEAHAAGSGGTVLVSLDGGLTWSPEETTTTMGPNGVYTSSASGWSVDNIATIIKLGAVQQVTSNGTSVAAVQLCSNPAAAQVRSADGPLVDLRSTDGSTRTARTWLSTRAIISLTSPVIPAWFVEARSISMAIETDSQCHA